MSDPREPIAYIATIERWNWSVLFGVSPYSRAERGDADPFEQLQAVEIHGFMVEPATLRDRVAEIRLVPDPEMNRVNRIDASLRAIGHLEAPRGPGRRGVTASIYIPEDMLASILTMLTAASGTASP